MRWGAVGVGELDGQAPTVTAASAAAIPKIAPPAVPGQHRGDAHGVVVVGLELQHRRRRSAPGIPVRRGQPGRRRRRDRFLGRLVVPGTRPGPGTSPTATRRMPTRRPVRGTGGPSRRRKARWVVAAVTAMPVERVRIRAAPPAGDTRRDSQIRPGLVTTGTQGLDSRWLITGIAAPPPTVATAARLAAESCCAPRRLRPRREDVEGRRDHRLELGAGHAIRSESPAARPAPRSWSRRKVVLASRHSSRSRVSGPTAMVPLVSSAPAGPGAGQHVVPQGLVDLVAGELGESQRVPDQGEVGTCVGQRDGAAAAPKSQRATTPRVGRPGCLRAANPAVASEMIIGGTPPGASAGLARGAPRSARSRPGPSRRAWPPSRCWPGASSTARAIASSAVASRASPGAPTVGRHQRHRVTDPPDEAAQHHPGCGPVGAGEFRILGWHALGQPVCPHRLSTERRLTGIRPGRAAARLVVPDREPQCLAHVTSPSLRHHHDSRSSTAYQQSPKRRILTRANPNPIYPPLGPAHRSVRAGAG